MSMGDVLDISSRSNTSISDGTWVSYKKTTGGATSEPRIHFCLVLASLLPRCVSFIPVNCTQEESVWLVEAEYGFTWSRFTQSKSQTSDIYAPKLVIEHGRICAIWPGECA